MAGSRFQTSYYKLSKWIDSYKEDYNVETLFQIFGFCIEHKVFPDDIEVRTLFMNWARSTGQMMEATATPYDWSNDPVVNIINYQMKQLDKEAKTKKPKIKKVTSGKPIRIRQKKKEN